MIELLIENVERKPGDLVACTSTDGQLFFLIVGYFIPKVLLDSLLPTISLN